MSRQPRAPRMGRGRAASGGMRLLAGIGIVAVGGAGWALACGPSGGEGGAGGRPQSGASVAPPAAGDRTAEVAAKPVPSTPTPASTPGTAPAQAPAPAKAEAPTKAEAPAQAPA